MLDPFGKPVRAAAAASLSLCRLGRSQKSRAAYGKAIDLAGNTAETASLTRRREQLR
jgi:predicted RNA polymerase sigma factor